MLHTIYLAGGCCWGVEKYMSNTPGVIETEVGFANGHVDAPAYAQVKKGDTGHAETVRTVYDDAVISLCKLLRLFFRIIDPTSFEQLEKLQAQYAAPLVVEACELDCFFPAEEYHQKYLDKTPGGYCHVPWEEIDWVKTVNLEEI